jgi:hypothetical protein
MALVQRVWFFVGRNAPDQAGCGITKINNRWRTRTVCLTINAKRSTQRDQRKNRSEDQRVGADAAVLTKVCMAASCGALKQGRNVPACCAAVNPRPSPFLTTHKKRGYA